MVSKELWIQFEGVFVDVFGDDDLKITKTTDANDIEDWDSLTHIRLIVGIEMEFNISFPTDKINSFKNVGELYNFVVSESQ